MAWRGDESDDDLLEQVAAGDSGAFGRLMDRHVDGAFRLAHRVLGDRSAAEDIVQDAFLQVWRKAASWKRSGKQGDARFSTWLWRVVLNRSLDVRRRPAWQPIGEVEEPADPSPDAEAVLAGRSDEESLDAALATLPERQRAAIALVYGNGASNAEAAMALGISVGALEQLLVRAKGSLRQRLKEGDG